jgi:hypothetical protein
VRFRGVVGFFVLPWLGLLHKRVTGRPTEPHETLAAFRVVGRCSEEEFCEEGAVRLWAHICGRLMRHVVDNAHISGYITVYAHYSHTTT